MHPQAACTFVAALRKANDAFALQMLLDRLVTVDSIHYDSDGTQWPILLLTCIHLREHVARGLILLGADIDAFKPTPGAPSMLTPAGYAIRHGKIPMLHLCRRLGANLSAVWYCESSPRRCAVEVAISNNQAPCLAYLLDEVYPARPLVLRDDALKTLCIIARCSRNGRTALPIFKVLAARGFDFSVLRLYGIVMDSRSGDTPSTPIRGEYPRRVVGYVDILVSNALLSGDDRLLRYLLKKIGIVADAERVEIAKVSLCSIGRVGIAKKGNLLTDPGSGVSAPDAPPGGLPYYGPYAHLGKYWCMACDAVAATHWCTGCKVVRYCSKDCGRFGWKNGHKEKCKELRRQAEEAAVVSAGLTD